MTSTTAAAAAGPRTEGRSGGDVVVPPPPPPPSSFVIASSPCPPPQAQPRPRPLTTNVVPTDHNNNNTAADTSSSAAVFYETAEYRCFNTSEIIHLLTPSTTPLPISSSPPPNPPRSGSLFLYDRSKTRNYKHDHIDWVKKPVAARRQKRARPPSKGEGGGGPPPPSPPPAPRYRVREDDVKLRYEGKCRVAAYYARGASGEGTMRRRTYCLIDPTTLRPNTDIVGGNWVLVHYLDSSEIVAPSRMVIGGGGGGSCCPRKVWAAAGTDAASSSSSSPPPPQSHSPMVPPSPPPPLSSPPPPPPPHRVTPAEGMDEDDSPATAVALALAAAEASGMDTSSSYHSAADKKKASMMATAVETEPVPSTSSLPVPPPPPLCDGRLLQQRLGGDGGTTTQQQLDSMARSALSCFSNNSPSSATEYVTLGGMSAPRPPARVQGTVTVIDEMCDEERRRSGGGSGGGTTSSITISDHPPAVPREYGGDATLGVFGRGAEIKLGGGVGATVVREGGGADLGSGSGPIPIPGSAGPTSASSSPVGVAGSVRHPAPCHRRRSGVGDDDDDDAAGMMTGVGGVTCPPPTLTAAAAGSEMAMSMELDDVDADAAAQAGLLRRASALVDSSPLSRILANIMQFQAAPKMTEEDFVAEWESSTEIEKSEAIEDIYGNAAVVTSEATGGGVGGAGDDCIGGGGGGATPSLTTSPHDSFGSDHGVGGGGGGGGPTTNEFVNELQSEIQEGKLALLEYELDRISARDKVGYLEATRLCPQLVSSRDVKLQFLRCENFCARKAAVRLVNYWTKRVELFGRERAFLPLTLEGAMSGDFEDPCFGHTRLLPGTDASGRGIIFLDYTINGSRTTKLRGLWYMAHAALENESIRRNGFIFIVFTCPPIEHFDLRLITEQQYLMGEAFPLRLRASHICKFETKGWFMPIIHAALKFTAGKYMRSRLVFHDGSTEKVMLQLAEYGISRTQLPTGIGGTFTEEEFQQWLALRREAGM